jgi:hypothetical protein
MDPGTNDVKVFAETAGFLGSGLAALLAAGAESAALTTSAIMAVLGFGGLLVRQIMAGQKMNVELIDREKIAHEATKDELHYVRWELESMRFRHGERLTDPGPFHARRPSPPPEADS